MTKKMTKKNPKNQKINNTWYLLDAQDMILGRLAVKASVLLRGKNRTDYARNKTGDTFVVVLNSDKLKVTGRKREQKMYRSHSGYMGGLKEISLKDQTEKDSRNIIKEAVSGMLPKNKLRKEFMKKLKVYKGADNPHRNVNFKIGEV